MVEVLIKWDVQETYILRYLLHCHEESESYTTSESRCLDSGLEKLIREPQSAQNTIPANRCEYVPLGSFFGFLLRSLCALSHVSWSMIRRKQNVKGGTDLEDFDFDDYDEDEPEPDEGDGLSDEEQEDEEA